MKKTENIFIIDYACGFHPGVCEVDYVCALRCRAALRAFKKYPHAYIVLGAGMSEVTGDCGPLADMMRDFLLENNVPERVILSNPLGYNTLTETEAVYDVVQKHGGGKIICATSHFHMYRVWCIWFFRFGIMPRIYTTKLQPPKGELVREMVKVPLDAVRSFLSRSKTFRSYLAARHKNKINKT